MDVRSRLRPVLLAVLMSAAVVGTATAEPRRHDGFYFRVGIGPGYPISTYTPQYELDPMPGPDSHATAAAVNTELALGTTIRPRLVLGIGTFPLVAPSPDYDGDDAGGQHVSATGPFVAWWLDDRGGLQLQAGLLLAIGVFDGVDQGAQLDLGYGAMAGVGYDRYVSDQLSLGGLARVTGYHLSGLHGSMQIAAPALLVTLTYH